MKTKRTTGIGYILGMLPVIAGIVMSLSSCSREVKTQKVNVNKEISLKEYKTYAWLPAGDTTGNSFPVDPTLSQAVRSKVNQELRQKGYSLNTSNPDLLVLVHTNYNKKANFNTLPNSYAYYGPGFFTGPWNNEYYSNYNQIGYIDGSNVGMAQYTEGTVVIDLIDRKSRKVVWRGNASAPGYDRNDAQHEIVKNINEIFEQFPG